MSQQVLHDFGAAEERGDEEGGGPIVVPGVHIGSRLNQGLHRLQVTEHRGRVQRAAPAVWRFFVQIRGGLNVLLDGLQVSGSGRFLDADGRRGRFAGARGRRLAAPGQQGEQQQG